MKNNRETPQAAVNQNISDMFDKSFKFDRTIIDSETTDRLTSFQTFIEQKIGIIEERLV